MNWSNVSVTVTASNVIGSEGSVTVTRESELLVLSVEKETFTY